MKSLTPPNPTSRPSSEIVRIDTDRILSEIAGGDGLTDPFAAAVRATRMPMIITDPRQHDNPIIFANAAFGRLTGYAPDEILGHNCRFLQGPDTDPRDVARIRDAVTEQRGIDLALLNYRKDGTTFWNQLLLAPVLDARGEVAYFFASQYDVTADMGQLTALRGRNDALTAERAASADRLQFSETVLRLATEAAEIGTWDLDAVTDTLIWSPRTQPMFGLSPNAAYDLTTFVETLHPEDRAATMAALAAMLDPTLRAALDIEYRIVGREDGVVRWLASKGRGIFDDEGRCVRAVGIVREVTERAEADLARREEEKRRTTLLELNDRLRDIQDPDALAFTACAVVGTVLGVSRVGYGVIDTVAETITIERDWNAPGIRSLAGVLQFRDYGSYIEDLKRGEIAVVSDASVDPRTRANADALESISAAAFVNMPLVEQGSSVALFYANHAVPRSWAEGEIAFMREVAGRVRLATERLRSERALRTSEEQFRILTQAIPNQVWAARPDGYLYWFNAQAYAYAGAEPGSLDGVAEWSRIVHPDDLPPAGEAWARSLATGAVYETEFRIRRFDGAYRWFLVRAEPVRSPDGAIVQWVGTNTDIDERRSQAAELAALNATLERQVAERTTDRNALWQLSTDIMLRCAFDGRIVAVNPAWTAMLGWREGELVGTSLFDLLHPDDIERTIAGARNSSEGQSLARFENRYRHRDGSYRWVSWSTRPDETLINAVGRDVTAEKEQAEALLRAEEQLRQSQKMEAVGQLTGGLAHDFNNLLAGISGSLELLQTRMAQGRLTDLDRYINAAQGASKRAAALTHRLLAFSRRQTLDPKPTNVNGLIAGMEELIRRTVGPSVHVEVVGASGLWPALVDPPQLENALLNLCINARDAMPDGGRITIETANKWLDDRGGKERDLPPGQYLSLCVSDTGTGMTPEVIERAFDPFFTTKPIGQGTGLGLSMIYGFVRQSGGHVRIYSEIGDGTTMCLYLPRHYGVAEEADPMGSLGDAPRAEQGQTVLIVDDEPTVRMLVTEVLEDLGYTAIEAADGPAGLKVLRSNVRIDLLVTDVGLPGGMNGRQVADAARVSRPGLKVLFITGYAENAVVGNGHLDPGMAVLTKPFVMEALASRIRELIAGP
ncbi:MAG: PAS domain-containing protein [Methylobacterium sp.]|uniref:PAS domain-containing protein n=1 Tax=Methylobacterium sp. TaxID=409 RepID=UPI00271D706E|nr:PAS domain-containing protein [Methylobacterium sp.]MDO9426834.1 PAS domain-containing protein [Methylobacterium sp.]